MKAISIDIETTGLDANFNQILEIGLVAFDTHKPFIQTKDNTLHIVFVQENIYGNIYALEINKVLITEMCEVNKQLKKENKLQKTIEQVDKTIIYTYSFNIKQFIDKFLHNNNYKSNEKITVAGKNFASFDKQFIDANLELKSIFSNIRHRVLDIGSLYLTEQDTEVPSLSICLQPAGLNNFVARTTVEDAIAVINCIHNKTIPPTPFILL